MKKHLLALVLAFVVGACGGGGGGGGTPSDGYTGKTTPATVNSSNGTTFSSASVAMSTKLFTQSSSADSSLPKPGRGGEGIVQKAISTSWGLLRTTTSGTASGLCGGSGSYIFSTNPDGSVNANFTYVNYNACGGSITGTITLSGTKAYYTATMNFTGDDNSTSSSNDYTHTYYMNVTFSGTDTLATQTFNMTVADMVDTPRGGDSSKMENFVITHSLDKTSLDYSMSMGGRLYYASYGYVTVSTPVTMTGVGSGDPTAGTLMVLGVNNVGVEVQYTSTAPVLYVNSAASPDTWTPV
jgi:hypothetical protein